MPPRFMIFPARIKNGSASRAKLSSAVIIFCAVTNIALSNGSDNSTVAIVARPMETNTGTLKNISRKKTPKRTRILNSSTDMAHSSARNASTIATSAKNTSSAPASGTTK